MSHLTYFAPDALPTDSVCRQLVIPNDINFIFAINDALARLTNPAAWEPSVNVSSEDAASAMAGMIPAFDNQECNPMIGAIVVGIWDGNNPNWLLCDGSLYQAADYPQLYAILSGRYRNEADGTFETPDLRGRFILGGDFEFQYGEGGAQTVALTVAQLPAHNHPAATAGQHFVTRSTTATGLRPADSATAFNLQPLGGVTTGATGSGQAHNNMPPYTQLQYFLVAR